MNEEFPLPLYLRQRRIHALERAADDQREQLRAQTAALVESVRGGGWWRELAGGMLHKVTGNAGQFGGALRLLLSRFGRASSKKGNKKMPWVSAILAGAAAAGFARWWKHRHDGE